MEERLLVISAHPDDETFGAGGTLLRYKSQGAAVYWLNVTDMREEYGFGAEEVAARQSQLERVQKLYGIDGFYNLALHQAQLDTVPTATLVHHIAPIIKELALTTILLPFRNDVHSDHRVVFEAAFSCTKVFRQPTVRKVLMMETVSETDFASPDAGFVPNYFVDISDFLEQKVTIAHMYEGEMKKHPYPRSEEHIRGLAVCRGAAAGCRYAEAFVLVKEIV